MGQSAGKAHIRPKCPDRAAPAVGLPHPAGPSKFPRPAGFANAFDAFADCRIFFAGL